MTHNGNNHSKKNGSSKISRPTICIIGPGVVGTATGRGFMHFGLSVSFVGVIPEQIEKLREQGYEAHLIDDVRDEPMNCDISMITVPTPTVNGSISLDYIAQAAMDLGKRLAKTDSYHVVTVKSTVPPGTTEGLVLPILEEYSGKKAGKDFGVCMNPEYLREVSAYEDFIDSRLVVIGQLDEKSGDVLMQAYQDFDCPVERVSLREAEMQKYIHNLYNAVKIGFFNEMREVANQIGADAEKLFKFTTISAEAIWNPKYGTKDRGPFSGACLPKDTEAFLEFCNNIGYEPMILRATINSNKKLEKKLKQFQQKHFQNFVQIRE